MTDSASSSFPVNSSSDNSNNDGPTQPPSQEQRSRTSFWNNLRQSTNNNKSEDFNHGTWMSLLGLLSPWEFFVTVDKTTLWRRHVAWAKPKGQEIRNYTTQQFASNIVFLSLLLGSEMGVFMNSSQFTTDIRKTLAHEDYNELKYYIGCIVILDICVTLLGLVATFTAWSMIAAISDSNSHAILRSSMGQYVTSLPMRLVVAALYLFLLWIVLILIDLMSGPVPYMIVAFIGFLFFQMVISLSCFGRLIIHTGAMGKKRVLDPEFERYLLPSGLHASLLIKATERCRRRTSATAQYTTTTTTTSTRNVKTANMLSSSSRNTSPTTSSEDVVNNQNGRYHHHYMPPPPPPSQGLRRSPTGASVQTTGSMQSNISGLGGGGTAAQQLITTGSVRSVQSLQSSRHSSQLSMDESLIGTGIDVNDGGDDGLGGSNGNGNGDDFISDAEHSALLLSARAFGGGGAAAAGSSEMFEWDAASTANNSTAMSQSSPLTTQQKQFPVSSYGATTTTRHSPHHRRVESVDTVESVDDLCHDVFPRPSVLNRVNNPAQLMSMVNRALDKSHNSNNQQSGSSQNSLPTLTEEQGQHHGQYHAYDDDTPRTAIRKLAIEAGQGARRKSTVAQLRHEWSEEERVRDLYGYEPPVQVVYDNEEDGEDDAENDFKMLPRISLLNKTSRLASLRNLMTFRGSQDEDDNNHGDNEQEGGDHHHQHLGCIEERGYETESSTRDISASRNNLSSSSVSSGADYIATSTNGCGLASNSNTTPRSSSRSPRNRRHKKGGNTSNNKMKPMSLSADSNKTPLLQQPLCTGGSSNSSPLTSDADDEETGTPRMSGGHAGGERQHLLSS